MNDGLTPKNQEEIREILCEAVHVDRAVLFGSRAMGTFSRKSDIDLALEGQNLDLSDLASLCGKFVESPLPYEVDLVIRAAIVNPELENRIEKHDKILYKK